jgi:hypothetical protein
MRRGITLVRLAWLPLLLPPYSNAASAAAAEQSAGETAPKEATLRQTRAATAERLDLSF